MRRHPTLQDLSRDHHDVLVHARRLRGLDARVDAAHARERFLRYADAVLLHHFSEEDAVLAPLAQPAHRGRLAAEHADLRRRIAWLAEAAADPALDAAQKELGEALRLHVRFEEDVLFADLQDRLDDVALAGLADELGAFRRQVRPQAGAGESCFLDLGSAAAPPGAPLQGLQKDPGQ